MKIANATCYNTDDLMSLWRRIREVVESNERESRYIRSEPDTLRIGYYTPKADPSKSNHPKYVREASYRDVNSGAPRINIVKRTKLPLGSPLHQLAAAADGSPEILPEEVLLQLATAMKRVSSYGSVDMDTEQWAWLKSFKVRFSLRAKRGEAAKAKVEDKRARIGRLRKSIQHASTDIRNCEAQLRHAQKERQRLIDCAKGLAAELGETFHP